MDLVKQSNECLRKSAKKRLTETVITWNKDFKKEIITPLIDRSDITNLKKGQIFVFKDNDMVKCEIQLRFRCPC
jgi:hypothetical protein